MSALTTSTQFTAGDHWPHWLVVKDDPVEIAVHHEPPCRYRPVMSDLPSPLKSPTLTSTQVTFGFHDAHSVVVNEEPVEIPVYHWPPSSQRPVISVLPSPLKSPT